MIEINIDEYDTIPNDNNSEYKNQFLEFLRKNKPLDTPESMIKVKKRKRRNYTNVLDT